MSSIASGLRIEADLNCEFEGHVFSVRALDDMLVIEVANPVAGVHLIRKLSKHGNLHFGAGELRDCLELLRSSLAFRVGGICVATARCGNSIYLGRLFSFKGLRVLPVAALRSALGKRL